jgi:exosortase/archaeosortase family protein
MTRARLDPRLALALLPFLFWDAWRLLAGRFGDGLSAAPLALVGLVVAAPALRRLWAGEAPPVPLPPVTATLLLYAGITAAGPPLLAAGIAAVTVALLCRFLAGGTLPWAPLAGLVLLALPVLPTLDFYLAYPMRLAGATLAATLLRLNGMAVSVEGVALSWNGSLLLFDAACSGIRMLWATLFLVSGIALAAGFGMRLYVRAILLSVAMAVAANAVRAAGLFYVENGFIERLHGPVVHEAVGLAAFLLFGIATIAMIAPRAWRPA